VQHGIVFTSGQSSLHISVPAILAAVFEVSLDWIQWQQHMQLQHSPFTVMSSV